MKLLSHILEPPALDWPEHARIVDGPADLALIQDPNLNLLIWRRELTPALDLLWRFLLGSRTALHVDCIAPRAEDLRISLGRVAGDPLFRPALAWWANDIASLAQRYTALTGVVHPRVRIERVEDGACILFHEDHMPLRILCTYAGPGMQWVANNDVDRTQLGLQGRRPSEANAAMVRDPSRIRSIPTAHVAVFKGALHPNNVAGALIHRSAPVSGPAEYRIRLTIDDTSDCGC